jgi:hypothetical protein
VQPRRHLDDEVHLLALQRVDGLVGGVVAPGLPEDPDAGLDDLEVRLRRVLVGGDDRDRDVLGDRVLVDDGAEREARGEQDDEQEDRCDVPPDRERLLVQQGEQVHVTPTRRPRSASRRRIRT